MIENSPSQELVNGSEQSEKPRYRSDSYSDEELQELVDSYLDRSKWMPDPDLRASLHDRAMKLIDVQIERAKAHGGALDSQVDIN